MQLHGALAAFTSNAGKTSALVIKYQREHISLRILLYLEDPSLWAMTWWHKNNLGDDTYIPCEYYTWSSARKSEPEKQAKR